MKKTITLQKIKFLLLALVIAVGVNYVSAWTGPTATAPGNNIDGLIDVSSVPQKKGGVNLVPPPYTPRLDIDDETNINDTFSTNNIAVWFDSTVVNDTYVNSMTGPDYVCADHTGKLVVCP